MKKIALTLMLAGGLSTVANAANDTTLTGDIQAGKTKSVACAACHGNDGNAALAIYPKLAGQHSAYLTTQLQGFRAAAQSGGEQGRNNAVMNGMAIGLSDQDIADLSAFYASLAMSPATTDEASIELAQRLYRGGDSERGITACIACHGPRGNGSPLSGFPKISFQNADYTKTQLEMFRSGERNNDLNGMMRGVAKRLTDEEIAALSSYLGGLH